MLDLCQLVKEKQPKVLFLMETKIRNSRMQLVRNKLGFEGMLAVDPIGLSGGIALLWKVSSEVDIQTYSHRHISTMIRIRDVGCPWLFTGFYGDPDRARREASWNLLAHLQPTTSLPWLCVGDFNEITDNNEKSGGAVRHDSQMALFRSTLEVCCLYDLGFSGPMFTWSNCREGGHLIEERLDRAIANQEWCDRFCEAAVSVLAGQSSDHNPLWVNFKKAPRYVRHKRLFKFEACWNTDDQCMDVVKQAWTSLNAGDNAMQEVQRKLFNCQKALVGWSSHKFRNSSKAITEKTKQLEVLQKDAGPRNRGLIKQLHNEIAHLLEMDDIWWK
jgi:exonuclease III